MVITKSSENKAIIVVDMQKDNVGKFCQAIIPNIALLIQKAREKGVPIIFACDSRYPEDFLFSRSGHQPRALRGSEGARVIPELGARPTDVIIEKRMLSGFFASDLDFTLRQKSVTTVIITGVSSSGCVLKTAWDAFELGYNVLVPADCCASVRAEDHQWALQYYRRSKMLQQTVAEVIALL